METRPQERSPDKRSAIRVAQRRKRWCAVIPRRARPVGRNKQSALRRMDAPRRPRDEDSDLAPKRNHQTPLENLDHGSPPLMSLRDPDTPKGTIP